MASIQKRGSTFFISVSCGYYTNGKQRRKTTTFKPPMNVTEKKAEKLAHAYAINWEEKMKSYTELDENKTFSELADWYYTSAAPFSLKPNTLFQEKALINVYVMPIMGRERLKNISVIKLDQLFTDLLRNGRVRDTYKLKNTQCIPIGSRKATADLAQVAVGAVGRAARGKNIKRAQAEKIAAALNKPFKEIFEPGSLNHSLSKATVGRIKSAISSIFSTACKKEIMMRNPCLHSISLSCSAAAASFLDNEECKVLLKSMDGNLQLKTMVTTLLYTGMRAGELCALRWSDIDFDRAIIHIAHTLPHRRFGDGEYILQSPKTRAGDRFINIPKKICQLLEEHRGSQELQRLKAGDKWVERNAVFTSAIGDFHSVGYLNTLFKRVARLCGFSNNIHTHSLRHSAASLMINGDVQARFVAEHLGHARTRTTNDLYTHLFGSTRLRTAMTIEIALRDD